MALTTSNTKATVRARSSGDVDVVQARRLAGREVGLVVGVVARDLARLAGARGTHCALRMGFSVSRTNGQIVICH